MSYEIIQFIIHPCDPTVVICYLIWPGDIAVRITYLISHSCIINTKLRVCITRRTSLGFPSWCPESTRPTDSCFQGTSCENLMMYGGLYSVYQHTREALYMYIKYVCVYPVVFQFSCKYDQTMGRPRSVLAM